MTLSNGTCLKELGTNRKEKVLEGVKKYDWNCEKQMRQTC
jgi:hypothetical protein